MNCTVTAESLTRERQLRCPTRQRKARDGSLFVTTPCVRLQFARMLDFGETLLGRRDAQNRWIRGGAALQRNGEIRAGIRRGEVNRLRVNRDRGKLPRGPVTRDFTEFHPRQMIEPRT